MKKILAIALMAALVCSAFSSYAWVCRYKGPLGKVYSADGRGEGREVAKQRALDACLKGKVHDGIPCEYLGCIKGF